MPERVPTEMAYDSDCLGRWFQARLVANLAPGNKAGRKCGLQLTFSLAVPGHFYWRGQAILRHLTSCRIKGNLLGFR